MVDKEEYRRRIILTASRIFSHYGFRKTTMDEISRALNKGKSSIYYYFASKEDIFEAVVLYEANQLRRQLTTAIKEVESPKEKLRNYIFVRMKAFAKLSNYYNAVFDKNLDHYEFIEKIRSRYDREELAILRLLLYVGNSRGVFEVRESEYTAMAIQTMLKGMEVPLFWRRREIDINSRLEAILNLIFDGILKRD
ncbi:MAG: TetR/AcrR family transcriptional regulator [Bacteroidales bacterium]|nr:TetR/AcrR family transcriptional regulator [Bacteroidales bacterium]MDT8374690.1 TetR/AcrR family transcriptional regulator [Bacteroidales bacterium]